GRCAGRRDRRPAAARIARPDGHPRAAPGRKPAPRRLRAHEGAARRTGRAVPAGRHAVDGHERRHRTGSRRGRDDGARGNRAVRAEATRARSLKCAPGNAPLPRPARGDRHDVLPSRSTRTTTPPMTTPAFPATGATAFIGGGNMARSLIGGLVARGATGGSIRVAEPTEAVRQALEADFGVATFADGTQA